jgi:hypothetical protein
MGTKCKHFKPLLILEKKIKENAKKKKKKKRLTVHKTDMKKGSLMKIMYHDIYVALRSRALGFLAIYAFGE